MKKGISVLGALLILIMSAHNSVIWAKMTAPVSSTRQGVGADWTTVTLSNPGSVTSKLFDSCLVAARTFEMTPFSIETEEGVEFQRHVPEKFFPLDNGQRVAGVKTILDCTQAAADAGEFCFMFAFDDTGCRLLFHMTYDLSASATCSGVESEAVYIRTTASSQCFLPAMKLATVSNGYWCAQVVEQTVASPQENSEKLCNAISKEAFGGNIPYNPQFTFKITVDIIQNTLGLMGYEKDVSVMTKWNTVASPPAWSWFGDLFEMPLPPAAFAAGIANGSTSAGGFQVLFMKAGDGFLLHPAKADVVLPAVLCIYGIEA